MSQFAFKGVSSKSMGAIAVETNFIATAPLRFNEVIVDGKDGIDYELLGLSNVIIPIELQLLHDNIDEIKNWLVGEGEFEFEGRVTKARFFESLNPERWSSKKKLKTNFIRDPYWYKKDDSFSVVTFTNNQAIIVNQGNAISKPIIRFVGSGLQVFEINGVQFRINMNRSLFDLDSEKHKLLYSNEEYPKQIEIGWEYPFLLPGNNVLNKISGNATVQIMRKDRWR